MSINFNEDNNKVYPYYCDMTNLVTPSNPYHHPGTSNDIEKIDEIREVQKIEHYKKKCCSSKNNRRIRKYYNRLSKKRVYIYKKRHITKNIDNYLYHTKKLIRQRKLLEWM